MTVAKSAFLKKCLRLYLREKCKKVLLLLGYYNDEIIINIKTLFLYGWSAFWIILHQKWFH